MDKKKTKLTGDGFSAKIPEIEKIIGYRFKDKSLITQAFTRSSFCNEHKGEDSLPYQSNEVLEFFGDGVLSAAIISIFMKDLSERYSHGVKTELCEGDFSNIKSRLSDKKNLSDRINELGLYKYLRMGEGDKKLGIEKEPSVMEDLFESIIGAIYIDCGMDIKTVISSVSRMLDVKKYLSGSTRDKNSALTPPIQSYKNALQEWCADKSRRLPAPVYETVSESGPDHKKVYERACYIGERRYSVGVGKNQKLADADAAEKALALLRKEESAAREKALPKDSKEQKSNKKAKEHAARSEKEQCTKAKGAEEVKRESKYAHTEKGADIRAKGFAKAQKDADRDAVIKLKEYAKSTKSPLPTFRDMGETDTARHEHSVSCKFSDLEAIGVAADKSAARCAAAQRVLELIRERRESEKKKEKKDKKSSLRVNKPLQKSQNHKSFRKGFYKK